MSWTRFLEKYVDMKLSQIQVGLICKIDKFDMTKFRADVQPLLKYKNAYDEETTYPIIPDIPVLVYKQGDYFIKPNYVRGDLVWVGFSTFDIENALREYTRAQSEKKFELHNACVLGAIAKENYSATSAMQESGFVFGKNTGTPEPAIKGKTFLDQLNTFLTTVGSQVGGTVGQNAAAITAIAAAANTLKALIETFKSQDVKYT
jgi:hypothetical protein